jgi:hypothetical protein
MKKSSHETILFNTDIKTSKNTIVKKDKTTNVNILLNRVRLNEKKAFKKKIFFLSLLILTICGITVFAII